MRMALPSLLLALSIAALSSVACVKVSEFEVLPSPTPQLPDRTDCGEILDSVFRSESERAWFDENCSEWSRATLGVVQAAPPAAPVAPTEAPVAPPAPAQNQSPPQRAEDPRCTQMRGQPYNSAADRAWFLSNCLGAASTQTSAFDTGPDRINCDEIRGTNYRSANERNWFLQNCLVRP